MSGHTPDFETQLAGRTLRPGVTPAPPLVVDLTTSPEHPALRDLRAYVCGHEAPAPEPILGWLSELVQPDIADVLGRLEDVEDRPDVTQVWAVHWEAYPGDSNNPPASEAWEEHDSREDAEHALRCGGGTGGRVVSRWVGPLTDWSDE